VVKRSDIDTEFLSSISSTRRIQSGLFLCSLIVVTWAASEPRFEFATKTDFSRSSKYWTKDRIEEFANAIVRAIEQRSQLRQSWIPTSYNASRHPFPKYFSMNGCHNQMTRQLS
jgi:hypothetical protein